LYTLKIKYASAEFGTQIGEVYHHLPKTLHYGSIGYDEITYRFSFQFDSVIRSLVRYTDYPTAAICQ
jgi:hypothetical protein